MPSEIESSGPTQGPGGPGGPDPSPTTLAALTGVTGACERAFDKALVRRRVEAAVVLVHLTTFSGHTWLVKAELLAAIAYVLGAAG